MKKIICVAVSSFVLWGAPARSAEKEGQKFPETLTVDGASFELNGLGLLRIAMIFKVYVAALYLGEGVKPGQVFEDVPKRLEVSYLRPITTNIILDAGETALSNNVPPAKLAELRPRINRMNALYQNVGKGDRYAITYIPGRGTELTLNGQSKGVVEGADFAASYFTIWLGAHAAKPELRDALLGRKK